jgi:hypothetical protein
MINVCASVGKQFIRPTARNNQSGFPGKIIPYLHLKGRAVDEYFIKEFLL